MADPTTEPQDDATATADEQQGFAEGFAEVRGDPAPPPLAPESEPAVAAAPPSEPDSAPGAEPAAPAPASEGGEPPAGATVDDPLRALRGYTPEQLTALLAKVAEIDSIRTGVNKLTGHLGTLVDDVRQLKAPAPPAPPVMSKDEQEAFERDYPEFANYLKAMAPGAGLPSMIEQRLSASERNTQELAVQVQEAVMDVMHPDWQDVINGDPYRMWLATQPEDLQQTAMQTASARELSNVVSAFKAFQAKAQPPAATAPAAQSQQRQANKRRLEAAVIPTAQTAPQRVTEMTEDEAFAAGFAEVAGSRL